MTREKLYLFLVAPTCLVALVYISVADSFPHISLRPDAKFVPRSLTGDRQTYMLRVRVRARWRCKNIYGFRPAVSDFQLRDDTPVFRPPSVCPTQFAYHVVAAGKQDFPSVSFHHLLISLQN